MGQCLQRSPDARNNEKINELNDFWEQESQLIRKLLLLGTGGSGKSTVFKQLKCIYGEGLDNSDTEESLSIIRQNCVTGMIIILRKAYELYEKNPKLYFKCKIDVEDKEIAYAISTLLPYGNHAFMDAFPDNEMKKIGQILAFLWKLPCVKETFYLRGNKFAFPENMEIFFDKIEELMEPDYTPTEDDIFKTRIRTTGLIEYRFEINKQSFYICDVGGQRNERKKWINSFSDVTAVVYVAALNHYNSLLFEDETKNAMHESIDLFKQLCQMKYFVNTGMMLFLNKNDLFRKDLKSGIPLSICFGADNQDWKEEPRWKGPNYHKKENIEEDKNHFENCYIAAKDFIVDAYTKNRDKRIYVHITCATDRDNVNKVFWNVQNIIVGVNLDRGGLVQLY